MNYLETALFSVENFIGTVVLIILIGLVAGTLINIIKDRE